MHLENRIFPCIFCLLLFLVIRPAWVWSQSEIDVTFSMAPGKGMIRIDSTLLDFGELGSLTQTLKMKPGKYKVELWAPYHRYENRELIVSTEPAKQNVRYVLRDLSPEMEVYKKELNAYKKTMVSRIVKISGISAAVIGLTATSLASYRNLKAKHEELDKIYDRFPHLIHDLDIKNAQSDYKMYEDQIQSKERVFYGILAPLTIASYIGGGIWLYKILNKKVEEPKRPSGGINPFTHEDSGNVDMSYRLQFAPSSIGVFISF